MRLESAFMMLSAICATCGTLPYVGQHDYKFVTTLAADGIDTAQVFIQPARDFLQ